MTITLKHNEKIRSAAKEQVAAVHDAAKATARTGSDYEAVQLLLDAAAVIDPRCADVAATLVPALARADGGWPEEGGAA